MYLNRDGNAGLGRKPRICMLTGRNYTRRAFQGGFYECQDVLTEVDDVDLICLEPGRSFEVREKWQRRLIWHDFTGKMVLVNPGFRPIRLKREYELFIVVCQTMKDLLHASAVKGWKDFCRTSVLWIEEWWASGVKQCKPWFPAIREFDHIVVGMKGSIGAVSDAIGRPCHYVPCAVDGLRFSPYPKPSPRVIDVYSIGRRWEGVHQALGSLSARKEIFYVFDTFDGSMAQTLDHRQHREMLANMAKRSRFFIVGPGKLDQLEETGGQIEVGYRYFEGSAAGTVMIGQVAECDAFRTMFDWPDAVIKISTDGSDVANVLSSLADQPARLLEISRRNATEALLRHDWSYRWKKVLDIAGMKPAPAMEARERRLQQLAEQAGNDYVGPN